MRPFWDTHCESSVSFTFTTPVSSSAFTIFFSQTISSIFFSTPRGLSSIRSIWITAFFFILSVDGARPDVLSAPLSSSSQNPQQSSSCNSLTSRDTIAQYRWSNSPIHPHSTPVEKTPNFSWQVHQWWSSAAHSPFWPARSTSKWVCPYVATLINLVSAVPDARLHCIVDALKHRLHLQLHACPEIPHVDSHEIRTRLHYRLIYSLLAEMLPLFYVFDHMDWHLAAWLTQDLLETVSVEVKGGSLVIWLRNEEYGLGLFNRLLLFGHSGTTNLLLFLRKWRLLFVLVFVFELQKHFPWI